MTTKVKSDNAILVAVYGTLKKGQGNNYLLGSDAVLIGSGQTESKFDMLDFGGYPGALEYGDKALSVEVWSVNPEHLPRVDQLEGHPSFYKREEEEVKMYEFEGTLNAWMYRLVDYDYYSAKSGRVRSVDSHGALYWERSR